MNIFISADIEGVTGTTVWDEATKTHPDYPEFQAQMTREVSAACLGALEAGADRILVKDAHSTARNLIAGDLPGSVELVRGWSRHPYMMMQELDDSFDAVLFVGYHGPATGVGNPLAHTMDSSKFAEVTINGEVASEFLINTYTAAMENVPVAFISGDREICELASSRVPGIKSVAVKQGKGGSTINIHPETACRKIKETVKQSLLSLSDQPAITLPDAFEAVVTFVDFKAAFRASFYPGARLISPQKIGFDTHSYMDVLRLLLFI
ncbi:MAG: amino acid amidase [Desulfobacteraceae bacterium]|nr:MAG: amino acid amidase [Desulfobacteraceae bacterium]